MRRRIIALFRFQVSGLRSRSSERIQFRRDVADPIPEGLLQRAAEFLAYAFDADEDVVARLRRHDRNGSSWRDELGATTLPLAMAQIAQRRSTSCSGDGGDRKRRRLDRKTRAAPPLKRSSDRRRNCCCRCRRRRRRRHRKSRPLQRPRAELHCHFFYAGCVDDVERVPRGCVRSEMSGGIDAWEDGIGMLKKDSTLAF